MRRISIFGATGSIGQSTIDLIRRDRAAYDVVALTGGGNIDLLAKDAIELGADVAVTAYEDRLGDLKAALSGSGVQAAAGAQALLEAADREADWIMSAIVGSAGLAPGLHALRHGTTLALANKESLVTAGPLLMRTAQGHGARVLPVDSEHSAVFQGLVGEDQSEVERVIITASGGPFRDWSLERLEGATLAQACKHPSWDMGQRITIDSASMFNKALEIIETKEYFGFDPDQIEVLVHPGSYVHALVGFRDGALMAHMGAPDMRHAIGYALHWPERRDLPVARLDLAKVGQLRFEAPDETRFVPLRLAREVMETGGLAGAVFNAAKEAALDHFIAGKIGFLDMARLVEQVLNQMSVDVRLDAGSLSLDNVLAADKEARARVAALQPALKK
ncbi:1-deoxy-D-xylulose-5-phosphate reductoisomerase [Celeribacter halophilus]|jgi:1-deoxy-D-xylulose-5-phosphate reductoisomerase|uniref:1-deoxy-D-xylulose-5-phosphate reductoisomerase n=1 Tax=Celeribacter halophilus TaxID=576117 RepID=UPI001C0992DC|nr:1-deoxy-D-xylulose-5-phosphate reductoisomerase [Celeribacter halophilus]MBU2890513.1 1-deoxy-D-xylulose-5-phosphate reductoisomerase [Celeribacter halophilus]MDO6511590.1 1-deoxy-D-xylulose-5-phosphate reductoisomerase [Celeribacter halophilus]